MNVKEELQEAKKVLKARTYSDLATILGTNKRNIESWIRRGKIPDKWRILLTAAMKYTPKTEAKLPLDNPELLEKIIQDLKKEPKQEEQSKLEEGKNATLIQEPTPKYNNLPADIQNIVDILKDLTPKQRRQILRLALDLEQQKGE